MPNPIKVIKGVAKAAKKEPIERQGAKVVSAADELARIAKESAEGKTFRNNREIQQYLREKKLERAAIEKEEQTKKATEEAAKKTPEKDKDLIALKEALASQKEDVVTYQLTEAGIEITAKKTGTQIHPANAEAATLEAINRAAQEQAAGQLRVVLEPTGEVRKLIGVDAPDARAYGGQIILQRGVGAEPWTVLSKGPDVKDAHIKGAIARAKDELDKVK